LERLLVELIHVSNGFIVQITVPSDDPDGNDTVSSTFVATSTEEVKKIIGNNVRWCLAYPMSRTEEPEQRVRTIKGPKVDPTT